MAKENGNEKKSKTKKSFKVKAQQINKQNLYMDIILSLAMMMIKNTKNLRAGLSMFALF